MDKKTQIITRYLFDELENPKQIKERFLENFMEIPATPLVLIERFQSVFPFPSCYFWSLYCSFENRIVHLVCKSETPENVTIHPILPLIYSWKKMNSSEEFVEYANPSKKQTENTSKTEGRVTN